jgi:hypothetical protein
MAQWLYITGMNPDYGCIRNRKTVIDSTSSLGEDSELPKSARRKAFNNSSNYRCPVVITEINF